MTFFLMEEDKENSIDWSLDFFEYIYIYIYIDKGDR